MNDWKGKRVAVSGAGGFIGSHLVEALVERGAAVRALVRYNSRGAWGHLETLPAGTLAGVEVILGDITDPFSTDRFVEGCDVVFHLAALIGIPYSYLAPDSYVSVNVRGTLNMLEAARRHRVSRFVHTSTSEAYGTAQYTPIDEKHQLQGQSPYSASKIAADKLAESYHRSFGVPVVTVRPFNTFGPRQSARAVIPATIIQALDGGDVRLGNLAPIRDLVFVKDTARGFVMLAESDRAVGQVANLATGLGVAVGALAQKIIDLMRSPSRVVADAARLRPDNSEVYELVGDASVAREFAGWAPSVSLDAGLSMTIDYIRQHAALYKPAVYQV